MRRSILTLFLISGLGTTIVIASGCSRAEALESFTLGEHDKVIVESTGCHAECRAVTPTSRACTVKTRGCRVTCTLLPECRPDGRNAIQVCAITREQF